MGAADANDSDADRGRKGTWQRWVGGAPALLLEAIRRWGGGKTARSDAPQGTRKASAALGGQRRSRWERSAAAARKMERRGKFDELYIRHYFHETESGKVLFS